METDDIKFAGGVLRAALLWLVLQLAPGVALGQGNDAAHQPINVCRHGGPFDRDATEAAVAGVASDGGELEQVRVVPRQLFIPDSGAEEVLVFRKFEAAANEQKLVYHVLVVDQSSAVMALTRGSAANALARVSGRPDGRPRSGFHEWVPPTLVQATEATQGPDGTDFLADESYAPKTLLRFRNKLRTGDALWPRADVYVVGCGGPGFGEPRLLGHFETPVSTAWLCVAFASAVILLFYVAAAFAAARKRERQPTPEETEPGEARLAYERRLAEDKRLARRLDPVALTAGADGLGNAGNLQVLFFSIIVGWLVLFIWARTGHLTGLSANLMLLMGLSGLTATAAGGTRLSKSRLDFRNWAWLVSRNWLQPDSSLARWRDIVTTVEGQFDVYRFQMVVFSVLVGMALIVSGVRLGDLTRFNMPAEFLGILGVSQIVYLAGGLIAPPTITDLNTQIEQLRQKEQTFLDAANKATPPALDAMQVLFTEDDSVKQARAAYNDYLEAWKSTVVMFKATLGKEVLKKAEAFCPPWPVPGPLLKENPLPDARQGDPYECHLTAWGGTEPYTWKIDAHDTRELGILGLELGKGAVLRGTPTKPTPDGHPLKFTVTVTDSGKPQLTKVRTLSLRIAPA